MKLKLLEGKHKKQRRCCTRETKRREKKSHTGEGEGNVTSFVLSRQRWYISIAVMLPPEML